MNGRQRARFAACLPGGLRRVGRHGSGASLRSGAAARHLAARNDLQQKEAARLARGLSLPFKLYPALKATDEQYKLLSEYYLLLRNLQRTQRYTEFVLRMNPFLTQLLLRLIARKLPCPLDDILEERNKRTYLSEEGMERYAPEVKKEFLKEMAAGMEH